MYDLFFCVFLSIFLFKIIMYVPIREEHPVPLLEWLQMTLKWTELPRQARLSKEYGYGPHTTAKAQQIFLKAIRYST